ncbi:MAG: S-layer homology domain-containing protein [Clostridia bacterium]|nr:S-layer homology domain-containing protein [Clostridia bacterium]
MYKKSIFALILVFTLVVSSLAMVSAAAFPDITDNHSWADEAISSMVERGILKGYTDGTFKPDRAVSHLETLIIASRIMGVDEEENKEYRQAAVQKYENLLEPYNIDYKDEVAYLLYRDVITTDEVASYISDSNKDVALKRYEAAVLLTKLVGGVEKALGNSVIVFDFNDASSIPSSAKAYVKYVFDIGLMKGVDNNNFNPNGELTRAMISTIMYRGENYMNASVKEGVVENLGTSSISVMIGGQEQEIPVPEGTSVKIDANAKTLADLVKGQHIRIHYQNNEIRMIDAVSSNLYSTVSGTISAVSESSGVKKITIKNASGVSTYPIDSLNCKYILNNEITTFSAIKSNQYAKIKIQSGYVTEISVETGSKTYSGKIASIKLDENVSALKLSAAGSEDLEFAFNENVTITRNGSTADIRSLSVGDSVTITITDGGISKVVATSDNKTVKGTITKIEISANSKVTIKTSTDEVSYGVTSDTVFSVSGDTSATIYDLRLGATAELRLDSTNISKITTDTLVVSPTMTGIITYIHPTSYVMGIQVVDAATGDITEVQTVVKSNVKITDTTSSNISAFRSLSAGMTVVVVGAANYGVYEVSQIIVTAK